MNNKSFYLNKKKSLNNNYWAINEYDLNLVKQTCQNHNLSQFLTLLAFNRNITPDTIMDFLYPTMKSLMPDPSHLLDLDIAATRVYTALQQKQKIALFADYDVDGATSAAILHRFFKHLGHEPLIYIPDRIDEGYGPNAQAMDYLKNQGAELIIMLDCGTTAFDPLKHAHNLGLDVIIIDHHLSEQKLPPCTALINPNRFDQTSDLQNLCTAGLSFIFAIAVTRHLRLLNYFNDNCPEPDLKSLMDLVALGTVCDVMPLTGLNRAFVKQGIRIMNQSNNIGINALMNVAGLQSATPSCYHLGFVMGPRINAGGRVGKSDLGAQLLSTDNSNKASELAAILNELNKERQEIEKIVLEQAVVQIQINKIDVNPIILVKGNDWHPGVIGIVASRIKELYNKPCCVVSMIGGIGKGSGRSVSGLNLGDLMHKARAQGLLINGGGHAMAAGFTLDEINYESFYGFLNKTLAEQNHISSSELKIDSLLTINSVNQELMDSIKLLEPFGNANPTPRFLFSPIKLSFAKIVGQNHVQCVFVNNQGDRIKGIGFRLSDHPIGKFLLSRPEHSFHVVGTIKQDEWNGKTNFTIQIEDLMID